MIRLTSPRSNAPTAAPGRGDPGLAEPAHFQAVGAEDKLVLGRGGFAKGTVIDEHAAMVERGDAAVKARVAAGPTGPSSQKPGLRRPRQPDDDLVLVGGFHVVEQLGPASVEGRRGRLDPVGEGPGHVHGRDGPGGVGPGSARPQLHGQFPAEVRRGERLGKLAGGLALRGLVVVAGEQRQEQECVNRASAGADPGAERCAASR